jgi:lipopolysaccharide transport system ATP-binding protein
LLIDVQVYKPLQGCIIGFFICDKNGNEIIGSNTFEENFQLGIEAGDRITMNSNLVYR